MTLRRAAELVERYADLRLGGTNASVSPSPNDSATARFSRWTVATSLSFSHLPPQASLFFRRDLRQRSRRPARSRTRQPSPRVIGDFVSVGERLCRRPSILPAGSHLLLPTDGHLNAKRDRLAESERPRPALISRGVWGASSLQPMPSGIGLSGPAFGGPCRHFVRRAMLVG